MIVLLICTCKTNQVLLAISSCYMSILLISLRLVIVNDYGSLSFLYWLSFFFLSLAIVFDRK